MAEKSILNMSANEIGDQLTPMQRALVDTLVAEDCTIGQAAVKAGYAPGNPESARVTGSKALRLPQVQAYLFKRTAEELGMMSVQAAGTLRRLLKAKSEYVQLETAKDLLNRTGFAAPSSRDKGGSVDVKVVIDLS